MNLSDLKKLVDAGYSVEISPSVKDGYVLTMKPIFGYEHYAKVAKEKEYTGRTIIELLEKVMNDKS